MFDAFYLCTLCVRLSYAFFSYCFPPPQSRQRAVLSSFLVCLPHFCTCLFKARSGDRTAQQLIDGGTIWKLQHLTNVAENISPSKYLQSSHIPSRSFPHVPGEV
ncbi:unnamed protein product [Pylaiella littoralis]